MGLIRVFATPLLIGPSFLNNRAFTKERQINNRIIDLFKKIKKQTPVHLLYMQQNLWRESSVLLISIDRVFLIVYCTPSLIFGLSPATTGVYQNDSNEKSTWKRFHSSINKLFNASQLNYRQSVYNGSLSEDN